MTIQSSGSLFELVQLFNLFPDSKTFPDAVAFHDDERIREALDALVNRYALVLGRMPSKPNGTECVLDAVRLLYELRFELLHFVQRCFDLPVVGYDGFPHIDSMEQQIERLWDWLTRRPGDIPERSTLLPLNYAYVVPGGRYIDFYYWDSYFTAVGLLASGRIDLLQHVVDNLADLIENNGFAPNANRGYYTTRSQAPYFCQLLQLLAEAKGEAAARTYHHVLRKEYKFWQGVNHLVHIGEGQTCNRYWDNADTPRPEGYREDLTTWFEAKCSGMAESEMARLYRNLRTAAESGWDFSSRWLKKNPEGEWHLYSIRTTSILPIDLNCLLYSMERQLARWAASDVERHEFIAASDRRRRLLLSPPFWDRDCGWFFDVEFSAGKGLVSTGVESIAGVYPLFCEVAGRNHAEAVARRIEERFLKAGGIVTSTEAFHTGQQWDYPNGWAPLQWVTVVGLVKYGYRDLAKEIAHRFVELARNVYNRSGKMMEKYDVCDLGRVGGGGEYPNQDGFGWTNGVVRAFLEFLDKDRFWRNGGGQ